MRWRGDPENYRHFLDPRPLTMEGHLAWYEEYLRDETRFDFMVLSEGRPVGTVGLSCICADSCEISYMIGEASARGRGFATEAVGVMTQAAFRELGVEEVVARILPGNDASARVVGKAGFEEAVRVYRLARRPVGASS